VLLFADLSGQLCLLEDGTTGNNVRGIACRNVSNLKSDFLKTSWKAHGRLVKSRNHLRSRAEKIRPVGCFAWFSFHFHEVDMGNPEITVGGVSIFARGEMAEVRATEDRNLS